MCHFHLLYSGYGIQLQIYCAEVPARTPIFGLEPQIAVVNALLLVAHPSLMVSLTHPTFPRIREVAKYVSELAGIAGISIN